ncbi:MAG: M28 family peptidase [Dehalococcoidia bacterium]
MIRKFLTIAPLVLLLAACRSGGGSDASNANGFDAERAMADVEQLASVIGERPSGSEAATAAADYIATEFAGARFGVLRSTYTYELDPNRPATVLAGNETVPAVTAGGSKVGIASGTAIAVGEADALPAGSLTGKIAIATRGGTSFWEKYNAVRAAGASALIIANTEPGELVADLGATAIIPVVSVNSAAAEMLAPTVAAAGTLTVEVVAPDLGEGVNIVARSATAHACVYLLMANYDSAPGSAGANDEASGIAVMLELARQFARRDELPAVCFIAMDGGASGSTGVASYANALRTASQPAAVIDLHDVGAGGTLKVSGETTLLSDATKIAGEFGIPIQAVSSLPFSSDLAYFNAPGTATLQVFRTGGQGAKDNVADIQPENLRGAGLVVGELLTRISEIVDP